MIWAIIPGPVKRAVAWAVAGLVAFAFVVVKLKRQWAVARDLKAATKRADDMGAALEVRTETDAKTAAAVRADLGKWVRPE